jgi:LmbE family N-acetylglucosaminyl deacetylase
MRPRADASRGIGAAVLVCLLAAASSAQRVHPPPEGGTAALEIALRRLGTSNTVMMVNAHPDDENNALIAMLAHGLGVRVVEVTLTRGEGGQNDLGPEHGLPLSVIRTEELLAAHRVDGAEQLFGRAIDFGYSFSVEETFSKWGKDEMLADLVRLVRAVRPDVVFTMAPDGGGGGQHHQASARIAREAFDAAADPGRFPEQLAAGLEPWKARRIYASMPSPAPDDERAASRRADSRGAASAPASRPESRPGDVTVDTDVWDPALGATYHEIGTLARSRHKTQGMARLLALPGPAKSSFRLVGGAVPPETAPATVASLAGLAEAFGIEVSLEWLLRMTRGWKDSFLPLEPEAATKIREALREPSKAVPLLATALRVLRNLGEIEGLEIAGLDRTEAELIAAIAIAAGLRFDVLSDDGTVVPGQEVEVSVHVANRAGADVRFERVVFAGFDAAEGGCATRPSGALVTGGVVTCASRLRIPKDAKLTSAHWKPAAGASRHDLEADAPFGAPFRPTPFRARIDLVVAGEPVSFDVPVEHRDGSDPLAGEKRSEVLVVPPEGAGPPVLRLEYQHTRRRHLVGFERTRAPLDTRPKGDAVVGYVTCAADSVHEAIRRLGMKVELLDEAGLDGLSPERHPVLVIGDRACELRPEVRRHARRLLPYLEAGGTIVVLYQRSGLDEGSGAPYPAKTGGRRVTDESAPVKVLVPDHAVFTIPNRLTDADWSGWMHERGRSLLETKDPRYVDLVEIADPFEFNKGPKRGALVEARVGKGRWIYVGLSLSRQLEEGVPGAYRLLENLLSLRGEPASH